MRSSQSLQLGRWWQNEGIFYPHGKRRLVYSEQTLANGKLVMKYCSEHREINIEKGSAFLIESLQCTHEDSWEIYEQFEAQVKAVLEHGLEPTVVGNFWFDNRHLKLLKEDVDYHLLSSYAEKDFDVALIPAQQEAIKLGYSEERIRNGWFSEYHLELLKNGVDYSLIKNTSTNTAQNLCNENCKECLKWDRATLFKHLHCLPGIAAGWNITSVTSDWFTETHILALKADPYGCHYPRTIPECTGLSAEQVEKLRKYPGISREVLLSLTEQPHKEYQWLGLDVGLTLDEVLRPGLNKWHVYAHIHNLCTLEDLATKPVADLKSGGPPPWTWRYESASPMVLRARAPLKPRDTYPSAAAPPPAAVEVPAAAGATCPSYSNA